jgi:hypothetical protein
MLGYLDMWYVNTTSLQGILAGSMHKILRFLCNLNIAKIVICIIKVSNTPQYPHNKVCKTASKVLQNSLLRRAECFARCEISLNNDVTTYIVMFEKNQ